MMGCIMDTSWDVILGYNDIINNTANMIGYTVDGSAKSESSVDGWFIPSFCLGFNHPFGGAGFLPSTV